VCLCTEDWVVSQLFRQKVHHHCCMWLPPQVCTAPRVSTYLDNLEKSQNELDYNRVPTGPKSTWNLNVANSRPWKSLKSHGMCLVGIGKFVGRLLFELFAVLLWISSTLLFRWLLTYNGRFLVRKYSWWLCTCVCDCFLTSFLLMWVHVHLTSSVLECLSECA